MGAHQMYPLYLPSKSHMCLFFVTENIKVTHWLVPKDFRPLQTSFFLPSEEACSALSAIFSTFSCHLTALRSQCPAGLSSCPPWCSYRQERREAVDLVAFSTVTALPSGVTQLCPWKGVSRCRAYSSMTAVTDKHKTAYIYYLTVWRSEV